MRSKERKKVTIQLIHLLFHDCVAVVLESSRIDTYAPDLRASRLVLKQDLGNLNSYEKRAKKILISGISSDMKSQPGWFD